MPHPNPVTSYKADCIFPKNHKNIIFANEIVKPARVSAQFYASRYLMRWIYFIRILRIIRGTSCN